MSFRIVPLLLVLLSLSISTLTLAHKNNLDAEAAYGPAIAVNSYEVLRKGKKIGTHTISFYNDEDALKVIAETHMKVKILFITAFKYKYISEETWQNGKLQNVKTSVNDNGKKFSTFVTRSGDNFLINTNNQEINISNNCMTTNHWNKTVVNYDALLNTVTGDVMPVKIDADINDENRFLVRGDLNIDTFYNDRGDWLGMEFDHPKGGKIEFRCLDCNNTPKVNPPRVTTALLTKS